MNEESFLWIRFCRDADEPYIIGPLTRAELEKRIATDTKPNRFGDWDNGEFKGFLSAFPGMEQLRQRPDSDGKALVLRIDVVVPEAVRVVEEWKIPA